MMLLRINTLQILSVRYMTQSKPHAPSPFPGLFADGFDRRLIGRKYGDKDVQADIKHFPFRVTNQNDKPAITVEVQGKDRSFSPEEVSAMVCASPVLTP